MKKKFLEIWDSNFLWICISIAIASFAVGEIHTLNKRVNVLENVVVCLIEDGKHQTALDRTILEKFGVLFHRDTVWYDRWKAVRSRLNADSLYIASKKPVQYNFYFSDSTKISFTGIGNPKVNGIK